MILFRFFTLDFHIPPISSSGAFCHTVCGDRKEGILDSIIGTRNTEICLYEYV